MQSMTQEEERRGAGGIRGGRMGSVCTDERPNSSLLLEHLRAFGEEGWELVSLTLNIDLAEHGPSHLLVFKRLTDEGP
jgi:hypothetical protein